MTKILRNIAVCLLFVACIFMFAFAGCSSNGGKDDNKNPDEQVTPGEDGDNPSDYDPDEGDEPGGSVPEAYYTVTFDLNYEGGSSITVSVAEGLTVTLPSDPVREGNSIFSGWYADAECTSEYDFSAPIYADTTVYAGWIEIEEGYYAVIFMWNYEGAGTYSVMQVPEGTLQGVSLPSPLRSGYLFKGWYTDSTCSTEASNRTRISENTYLYAKWYEGYTFEAEYTNFYNDDDELRGFQGYSQNSDPIRSGNNASGGYYVGDMYVNECYIYFEIESDKAVDDAELHLCLAMDFGWNEKYGGYTDGYITFDNTNYKILVNGEGISYSLRINISNLEIATDITRFQDFTIGDISLKEGTNVIRLEVANEIHGQGGTQEAAAPLVDYMTLYTSASLTWDPIYSNTVGR